MHALQVQDVTLDPQLESRWAMEVPVIMLDQAGTHVPLPRESPRLSADRLAAKLEQHITQALDLV